MSAQAYVIRHTGLRLHSKWIVETGSWLELGRDFEHPHKGLYVRQGGMMTPNLQEAMTVFKESKRSIKKFGGEQYEWVPIKVLEAFLADEFAEKAAKYDDLCR